MTPLNASNRSVPSDDSDFDAQVLLEQVPADRAVEDGWDTEYVRSTDGTTGNMQTVGTQPASLKRFTDDTVPATTGTFQWNARHVKVGSTAGSWAGWVKGRPRTEADSTGESFPTSPDPAITFDTFQALDDSTNVQYTANWTPNPSVSDNKHSVEATFIGTSGLVAGTDTVSNPVSDTTASATDSGAGDGAAPTTEFHRCELSLLDSSSGVIQQTNRRTIEQL